MKQIYETATARTSQKDYSFILGPKNLPKVGCIRVAEINVSSFFPKHMRGNAANLLQQTAERQRKG